MILNLNLFNLTQKPDSFIRRIEGERFASEPYCSSLLTRPFRSPHAMFHRCSFIASPPQKDLDFAKTTASHLLVGIQLYRHGRDLLGRTLRSMLSSLPVW
jgi:hypothetical protein